MNMIQKKELKEALHTSVDQSKLIVMDAMTPANFDWIYETIETAAIACRTNEPGDIVWMMSIKLPVDAFGCKALLLPALIEFINEDKIKHADIYYRLNLHNGIMSSLGGDIEKEAIRAYAKLHFKSISPSNGRTLKAA